MQKTEIQKREKTTINLDPDIRKWIDDLTTQDPNGIRDNVVNRLFRERLEGKSVSDATIPKGCESCLKCGFIIKNGKLLCITKKTETDPIRYDWIPLEVVGVCSEKTFNTPINKKTREQYEKDLSTVMNNYLSWKRYAEKLEPKAERLLTVEKDFKKTMEEFEEARKGKEDLLNAKSTLESGFSNMKNALLERDEKIAVLETDNEQFRVQIAKLSENELLRENDSLHVQLNGKIKLIDDYAYEVTKLEALLQSKDLIIAEVLSKTKDTFRDFKQFLPTSLEPYDIQQYTKAMLTKIIQFEGYLNIVTSNFRNSKGLPP
jgi:hypothetical protein